MRVLIIDDDPVVRHILSAMVTGYAPQFLPAGDAGVVLEAATSGTEGIEAVLAAAERGELPDLLFLDLQLLDMTGLEVLQALEEKLAERMPPVIPMSAQPLLELQKQTPGRSWSLFLQKPFLPDQVVAAIRQALSIPA